MKPDSDRSKTQQSGDLKTAWEARRGQFASDTDVVGSPIKRAAWASVGLAAVALGVVGAFVPILPTTPFLILAAACFARSSARFYNGLLSHRIFGPVVYEWRENRTIGLRTKAVAITLIIVTFTVSIVWVVPSVVGQVAMGVVGAAVIVWLISVPLTPPGS